jgi:hypothetical protein
MYTREEAAKLLADNARIHQRQKKYFIELRVKKITAKNISGFRAFTDSP